MNRTHIFGFRAFLAVLTLSTGAARAASDDPLAIRLPPDPPASVREAQGRLYAAAQKQAHHLLGTVRPWSADTNLLLLTDSKSLEHWIRPNCGAVEGFCFLYRFGPYDASVVGVSRADLLAKTVVPMMRYLVATHVTGTQPTGDGKKWGDHWQSAHWTQMLGRGAWFAWADLPDDLRDGVRRVVAHEADRIAATRPPHQVRNDTKAEENAWNSQVLSVAAVLMPGDPRRAGWEKAHQAWVMSSFQRAADAANDAVVDGRPVRDQFFGANLHDDFTLENHGFVHPDYMTCFSLSLGCAPDFLLSGRKPPEAMRFNVAPIYENLKWMLLPDGSFVYPNGQDWELFRQPAWIGKHAMMAVYGGDPDAWAWLRRTLGTMERMQARQADGAIYRKGEYFFASTQHDIVRALGNAWLILQGADSVRDDFRDRLGVRRLDAAQAMLHRTPAAVHTVSWGPKIMAQCVPYRADRLVSPHERNGVGYVRLAGGTAALPLKLRAVEATNTAASFEVRLEVDHGTAVRAHLVFRSNPDGSFDMEERLEALADVKTADVATGLIGILNNPDWIFENGRRRIEADGQAVEVLSGAGREWTWNGAKRIGVDGALDIRSDSPLSASYRSAKSADRGRVTDLLFINRLAGERAWKTGDILSRHRATLRTAGDGASGHP